MGVASVEFIDPREPVAVSSRLLSICLIRIKYLQEFLWPYNYILQEDFFFSYTKL